METTLDNIIKKHRETGGNIISLLQDTQEAFGYVPKEAVQYLSDTLGIAPSRFYGVATFYSQFRLKPSGKNRITACCGTACHVRGAERILTGLKRELHLADEEDTTPDGQFTVDKVACLGFCSFAPVVLINGAVHGKTTADPILKEIKALRKK
ncbi:MAG: dehydrogenase (ubiquinone) 24 kDa subunit [Nitrospirae bacterium]|nr:dehydrogenase (ubiquinone) 24 kDa subunit [Nitrospirota bacterium]